MQIVDALRNTIANDIDADIGATGFARFYNTALSTLLASCSLQNPAFGTAPNPGAGQITLSGTPSDTPPLPAAGTATRLGLYQNSTAVAANWRVLLGINTTGTPDVTMANNVIATTDTVQISSLVITVPAGTPTT
jgi:hypothetical protein